MQRSFLSNLFLIILLNLLVKPFFILGIDAEVQNRLGEAVYGNYFALLNFSFLLNILLDLGITNYNTRNIAQHPQLVSKHFGKILGIRLMLFVLYAVFTLVSGLFIGYSGEEFYLLAILMFNQFLVATIQFCRSNFGGLHLFRTDALISVMDRFLLIIFCSVLLWTNFTAGEFRITWFVYAQTLAYGITAVLAIALMVKESGAVRVKLKPDFSRVLLRNSFPYALLILLMMMYNRLDSVMLERLLPDGDEQAGVYAQGFRYLDAVNMFALLFAGMLLPVFARQIRQKGDVKVYLELALRLLGSMSILTALTAYLYAGDLLEMRYAEVSDHAVVTFGYLILSFVPVSLTYIYGTLLTANGSLRQLNIMALTGLVLNLVLNFALIPVYGVEGAAVATLTTQGLTALIQVVLVYRQFNFAVHYRIFVKLIMLGLGVIALSLLLEKTNLHSGMSLVLVFLSGVAGMFALRLVRVRDLREMIGITRDR